MPFGGRDQDVNFLDAWLDDATAPPRYLLTAPAGRGKSALLVRWLQHLQEQGRVGQDVPTSWQLVFVLISIRFETHHPDIFYEAIRRIWPRFLVRICHQRTQTKVPITTTTAGRWPVPLLPKAGAFSSSPTALMRPSASDSTPDGSLSTQEPVCDSCFQPAGRLVI